MLTGRRARIIGTGIGVPARILTNTDLEKMVDTSDEWITARTGIKERRIAAENEATCDFAEMAARQALSQAGIEAAKIDLIILCTVGPDRWVPPSACTLQHRLGACRAAAFDLNAACSGFLYGMAVANQFIAAGKYEYILLIGAETLSRIVDYQDRNTCVLFGDGAGAVVLAPAEGEEGVLSFFLGADGGGGELLQVPAGGSRIPPSHHSVEQRLHYVQMKGNEVFKQAVRTMVRAIDQALSEVRLERSDIDWLVPHQANRRIMEAAAQRLGLATSRVVMNIERYGNTASASIPIALAEGAEKGLFQKGQIIALAGFGAGLTWGSVILRWG